MSRIAIVCLLSLGAAGATTPPKGLRADAPEAARTRYNIAITLYREGRFEDAAREFGVALQIHPKSPKLAYNLARALERARQYEAAIDAYVHYLKLAPKSADRPDVEATLGALRKLVADKRPLLVVTSSPPGADVFVDGATTSSGKTPVETRVTPGAHVLRLRLAGYAEESLKVDAVAGKQAAADTTLRLISDVADAPSPDATTPTRWQTWTGWGAIAGGAVAVGLGTVFHLSARDGASEIDALDPGERAEHTRLSDDIDADNLAAALSFGIGAALVATGVTLLWWPEDAPTTAGPTDVEVAGPPALEVRVTPAGPLVRW